MSLNALVVDDSALMRSMVMRALRIGGVPLADVHTASHGREALEVLAEHWIDVALVDLNMPVMDGLTLLETIRGDERFSDIAVVVVSTEASESRIARVRALNAAFVRKPFAPEVLRDTVIELTGVNHELECATSVDGDGDF